MKDFTSKSERGPEGGLDLVSKRFARLAPSPTLAVDEKAKALKAQGVKVLSFAAGEPDFDTPRAAKDAAVKALAEGFTKYCPAAGIPELRKAVSEKLKTENGLAYAPEEVLITTGAKYALYAVAMGILDPGDEAIIPAPYWVTYPEQVILADAKPVFIPTREEDGFHLRPETLEKAITSRTKVLLLASPNNPTGAVLSREELAEIAKIAVAKNIAVVSDEIYEHLIYDGTHHSIAAEPGMRERTIVVNGASKAYAMTGWRLGWIAAPKKVAGKIGDFLSQSTSNATSFAQKGAVAAYASCGGEVEIMRTAFAARRDRLADGLSSIPGFRIAKRPEGAFYLFPNVDGAVRNLGLASSQALAERLLEKAHVAVVPGEAFGAPGFLRFSYACSESTIDEGVERIRTAVA